jgi:serine/threonine protein kinase
MPKEFDMLLELKGASNVPQITDCYFTVTELGRFFWNAIYERFYEETVWGLIQRLRCLPKEEERSLQPLKMKALMKGFLTGLFELHKRSIIHRNLHPGNILVSRSEACITGLGCATYCGIKPRHNCMVGREHYRAPELVVGVEEYYSSVDIWCKECKRITEYLALGCIFFEMLTGEKLF